MHARLGGTVIATDRGLSRTPCVAREEHNALLNKQRATKPELLMKGHRAAPETSPSASGTSGAPSAHALPCRNLDVPRPNANLSPLFRLLS